MDKEQGKLEEAAEGMAKLGISSGSRGIELRHMLIYSSKEHFLLAAEANKKVRVSKKNGRYANALSRRAQSNK